MLCQKLQGVVVVAAAAAAAAVAAAVAEAAMDYERYRGALTMGSII